MIYLLILVVAEGFEPTKLYALPLEDNPFDRSGILPISQRGDSNTRQMDLQSTALPTELL